MVGFTMDENNGILSIKNEDTIKPCVVIYPFQYFHESAVGLPNPLIRSGLFAINDTITSRQNEVIAAYGSIKVCVSGLMLNQFDKALFKFIINKSNDIGRNQINFQFGEAADAMGFSRTQEVREHVKLSLIKMATTVITIKDGESYFSDHLIGKSSYDAELSEHFCIINNSFIELFNCDSGWTLSRLSESRKVIKNKLANYLYDFYMSHKKPYPLGIEKIMELTGSKATKYEFRRKIKQSCEKLEKELGWECKFEDDKLTVNINKSKFKSKLK